MSEDIVTKLFDEAYSVKEDQANLNSRRNAVRSSLRNLRDAGVLDDEQSAEIDELFPPKRRGAEVEEVDLTEDNNGGDE